MESTDKQLIVERIIRGLFLFFILGLGIWYAPTWMLSFINQREPNNQDTQHSSSYHHIEEMIANIRISPHNEDVYNGIHFATYLTENPKDIAEALLSTLQEQQIESYLLTIDDWDMDLYIYHEGILVYRLLFLQKISVPPIPVDTRPKIVIVISGLGETRHAELLQHPTPLTLASSPKAPFSPLMAIEAAKNWHEVLIDLRDLPPIDNPIELLPFASGFLHRDMQFFAPAQDETYVYPSDGKNQVSSHPLSLQSRKYIDIPNIIARAKQKAIIQGFAGIVIDYHDPQRDLLLNWTHKAEEEGFHLVMASELRYRLSESTAIPKEPAESP